MWKVTYRGPAARIPVLAQMIREEGFNVSYAPPSEKRSIGQDIAFVTVYVTDPVVVATDGLGSESRVRAAVNNFTERIPDTTIEIEEDTDI